MKAEALARSLKRVIRQFMAAIDPRELARALNDKEVKTALRDIIAKGVLTAHLVVVVFALACGLLASGFR